MREIECFVCDATFESKTSHLKFIGKDQWHDVLVDDASPSSQPPSVEIESQVPDQSALDSPAVQSLE